VTTTCLRLRDSDSAIRSYVSRQLEKLAVVVTRAPGIEKRRTEENEETGKEPL
jgi:hypothetical protein